MVPAVRVTYETKTKMKTYVPRSTQFAKLIESVDPKAKDGYGYHGEFVNSESPMDAEPGFIVLSVDKTYHRKRGEGRSAGIYVLLPDGSWWALCNAEGMDWAFQMREEAIAALAMTPEQRLAKALHEKIADLEKNAKSKRDSAELNRSAAGEYSDYEKAIVADAEKIEAEIAALRAWKPSAASPTAETSVRDQLNARFASYPAEARAVIHFLIENETFSVANRLNISAEEAKENVRQRLADFIAGIQDKLPVS